MSSLKFELEVKAHCTLCGKYHTQEMDRSTLRDIRHLSIFDEKGYLRCACEECHPNKYFVNREVG